ncbi:hypothetical protein BJ165DRAFT_1407915 [Panaeolus papilionaceus]|nr:hypothetical protein BJ165DRAFT_1407915 [Panaeolus papilionaceus]
MLYSIDNIIASRDPEAPLGALDGQVAALMEHAGVKYVITTPNRDYVPVPPVGVRQLRLRSNLRYGLEDHTQWPQFHVMDYPHLFAILSKPHDINNVLSILWWTPTQSDFESDATSAFSGMGHLPRKRVEQFQSLKAMLEDSVADLLSSENLSQKTTQVLTSFKFQMYNAVERLAALAMPFDEVVFNVTEFQRVYLSLEAMLRYRRVYQPRLNNPDHLPPPCPDNNIIGAFTMNGSVAQHLYRVGVPVWFVQEWDGRPLRRNVLQIVDVVMPCPPFKLADHSPPFPTIFSGLMTDEQRYTSICTYSLKRQLSPDPFMRGNSGAASVLASTSTSSVWVAPSNPAPHIAISNMATLQGPSHPPKAKKRKQDPDQKVVFTGRNKFEPLEHPFAPYSIPAWRDALVAVNYSPAKIVDKASADHNCNQYVFPDPGLILNSKHTDVYILNWLRLDRVWHHIVAENGTLSPQDWRYLLFLDLSKPPPDGNATVQQRCRELYEKLQTCVNRFSSSVKLVDQFSNAPRWNSQPVTAPVPERTVREIMWTLYKYNFTFELISLDRRACLELGPNPTDEKLDEREKLIRACFAAARFKLPEIDPKNIGLASDELEDRLPYIIALGKVIKSWTLDPDPVLLLCDRRRPELHLDQSRRHGLERVVTQLYCQTFWNYFGRAAQIPHRLHRSKNGL